MDWVIYLPLLIPVVGSLVLLHKAWRQSPSGRALFSFTILGAELVSILINLAPFDHRALVSDWPAASFVLGLALDASTAILLLTMVVLLSAVWLVVPRRADFDLFFGAIVFGAILVILAGTTPAIYFSLAVFDLVLFIWRLTREIDLETTNRAFVVGLVSSALFLAGILLQGSDLALPFLTIALWARFGIYPFHWLYPMRGSDSRDLMTVRALPLLAAASLWLRSPALLPTPVIGIVVIFGAAALLASIASAWREEQPPRAAIICALYSAVLIPLASSFGGSGGINAALELALSSAIALAFFETALRWRADNSLRWPRILWLFGICAFAGVPLSPGFFGRIALYVALVEAGQLGLAILVVVSTLLMVGLVWHYGASLKGAETRQNRPTEWAAVGVLALWTVVAAVLPLVVPVIVTNGLALTFIEYMLQSNDALIGLCAVFALLPLFFAPILGRMATSLPPSPGSLVYRFASAVDLDWLPAFVTGVGFQMGAIARNLAAFAEENPAVWILLVALWVAILVLVPR